MKITPISYNFTRDNSFKQANSQNAAASTPAQDSFCPSFGGVVGTKTGLFGRKITSSTSKFDPIAQLKEGYNESTTAQLLQMEAKQEYERGTHSQADEIVKDILDTRLKKNAIQEGRINGKKYTLYKYQGEGPAHYRLCSKNGELRGYMRAAYKEMEEHRTIKFNAPGYIAGGFVKGLYLEDLHAHGEGVAEEMIKSAVKISKEQGQSGKVYTDTPYIEGQSQVPLFYSLGFRAITDKADQGIKIALGYFKNADRYYGPQYMCAYLPMEKVQEYLQNVK